MWRFESLILLDVMAGLAIWSWVIRNRLPWTRLRVRGGGDLRRRQRIVDCIGVGVISGVAILAVTVGFVDARGLTLVLGLLVGGAQVALGLAFNESLVFERFGDEARPPPVGGAPVAFRSDRQEQGKVGAPAEAEPAAVSLVAAELTHPHSQNASTSDVQSQSDPVILVDSQRQPSTEELVGAAVNVARTAGLSWDEIGEILGMDPQTARGQYWSTLSADGGTAAPA